MASVKNVGAHSPTKIPNLSACALDSASADSPPAQYQIPIDPRIDKNPRRESPIEHFLQQHLQPDLFSALFSEQLVVWSLFSQQLISIF